MAPAALPGTALTATGGGSAAAPLLVQPASVEFTGVRPGLLYLLNISIRNRSSTMCRMRIRPPATPYFKLNYTPTGALAPGLDIRAEVEFTLPAGTKATEFYDRLVVVSGDAAVEVPLRASLPAPEVTDDAGGLLNLGLVVLDQSVRRVVTLENCGTAQGDWSLTTDGGAEDGGGGGGGGAAADAAAANDAAGTTLTFSPASGSLLPARTILDVNGDGKVEEHEVIKATLDERTCKVTVEFTPKGTTRRRAPPRRTPRCPQLTPPPPQPSAPSASCAASTWPGGRRAWWTCRRRSWTSGSRSSCRAAGWRGRRRRWTLGRSCTARRRPSPPR